MTDCAREFPWTALIAVLALLLAAAPLGAQDLEPRAYAAPPICLRFVAAGLGRSSGGLLRGPRLPVRYVEAAFGPPSDRRGPPFARLGPRYRVRCAEEALSRRADRRHRQRDRAVRLPQPLERHGGDGAGAGRDRGGPEIPGAARLDAGQARARLKRIRPVSSAASAA